MSEQEMMQKKQNYLIPALGMTFLVSLTGFFLGGHFPIGKRIYLYGDYYVQYVQFIRMFWRELLQGHSLDYSFSVSMGQPVSLLYAYYCLSPCNVFFAFVRDADTAAYLTMLAKQLLAAGCFYLFCKEVLKSRSVFSVIFAAAYAQCGYLVCFFSHINLLDSLYFLPLLLWLLWRFVQTEKWYGLCLAYAASFIVCFYGGYQTGVFSAVIYVILLWYIYGKPSVKWVKSIRRYLVCVFCAGLMSSVVTLPAAMQLLGSGSSSNTTEFGAEGMHFWDLIASLFIGRNYGAFGKTAMIYTGVVMFYTVSMFLISKKNDIRKKILFLIPGIFLLLCIFVKPFYLLIHAFDYPDGNYFRFSYMVSFLLAAVSVWQMEHEEDYKKPGLWLLVVPIVSAVYFAVAVLQRAYWIGDGREKMDLFGMEINAAFLLFYGLVLYFGAKQKKWRNAIFVVIAVLENIANVYFSVVNDGTELERLRAYYDLWQEQGNASMEYLAEREPEEDTFYRVRFENTLSANNSAFWGYHGIGYFSTIEQPQLKQLLDRLGYYASAKAEAEDYGGTPLTQALFAQKYRIHGTNPRIEGADAFAMEENPDALPLAYLVSKDILKYHAGSEDPFQNQEMLLSAMVGEKTDVFLAAEEMPVLQKYNVCDGWFDVGQGWIMEDLSLGGGAVMLRLSGSELPAYCYFSQAAHYGLDDSARVITDQDDGVPMRYSYLYTPHIMKMGIGTEGTYDVNILIDHTTVPFANFQNAYFYYMDEECLALALERLKEGGVELKEDRRHRLYGNADTAGGLLFTSVPYDEGWEAYVDEARCPVVPVCDGAFLAMEIPAGSHRIELRYVNPWIRYGGMLSMLGGGLLLACFVRTRRKKQAQVLSEEEKAD